MKILIPILGFGRAGGNRVLSKLANEWIKEGHEVCFLCPSSSDAPYFPTQARILWCNPQGGVSSQPPPRASYGGVRNLIALYRGLSAVGQGHDVILANQSLTAWPVALAAAGSARKAYYVQGYEPEFYLLRKQARALVAAVLSALSYHLPLRRIVNAQLYCRYRNLRAGLVVPPGLDLSMFRPAGRTGDLADADEIVLGCLGRPDAEKGTEYALRAFELLHAHDPRYRLRIAYYQPENWRHPACELVVPENDAQLADYYRSLDVILAPATGQPGSPHYPVLEGGASGIAVVTTGYEGVGYLGATDETAWLVEQKSAQAIVQAVQCLVAQSVLREERKDRFLALVREFSWPSVSGSMLKAIFSDRLK
jgi:glycosyltransferase involved in cell wall biosynthesis